jgi:phage/plasmid-like protein (TIGR03299 family)
MAHNLDITDGTASFVSAHTAAWHQLGNTLDHSFTAEEAMKEGNLGGWNVRKRPLFTEDEKGHKIVIPNMNAIVRDNPIRVGQIDVLSRYGVSDGYQEVQNEDHAGFLNALVDESGAHFDTAGALDGGRQVFLTMKMPGHIQVGGVDPVDMYLAAINSHDGSMAFTLMVTPVRIVCANTMNLAFENHSNVFRIRHTTNVEKNIRTVAREALDMSFKYLDAFQKEAEVLINTTMTQAQFEAIVEAEFGAGGNASASARTRSDRRMEEMFELFAEAQTQEGIRDTAWAGLNALTEWADHFSGVRGDDHDQSRAIKAIMDPSFKNRALKLMRPVAV